MKILAIDPGVTTGYCFAELHNWQHTTDLRLKIKPEQHRDDVEDFWDRVKEFAPRYIICEDFEYRNRARAGLILFSVQLIGIASLYEAKAMQLSQGDVNCALILQKAAQGKSFYTNNQLKNIGVFKSGKDWEHSMDATRHLLQWLTFGAGYKFIEGRDIKELISIEY